MSYITQWLSVWYTLRHWILFVIFARIFNFLHCTHSVVIIFQVNFHHCIGTELSLHKLYDHIFILVVFHFGALLINKIWYMLSFIYFKLYCRYSHTLFFSYIFFIILFQVVSQDYYFIGVECLCNHFALNFSQFSSFLHITLFVVDSTMRILMCKEFFFNY